MFQDGEQGHEQWPRKVSSPQPSEGGAGTWLIYHHQAVSPGSQRGLGSFTVNRLRGTQVSPWGGRRGPEAETLCLQLAALLEPQVTQGYLKTGQRQLAPVSMVT